jgi:hypothetical protein
MRVDGCCTLYYCFGDTLTSHDILYGITSGFILATDKSSMNLLNIKISIPSKQQELFSDWHRCPGGSMSLVVGSNSSYKPITNMALVRAQLCKLQKGCTRFAAQVIKFTSCFPRVGGSLRLPPPLTLVAMI